MTNLGLKTLAVVPCYCHHALPTMLEALNTVSLSICHPICESGHLLVHRINNVFSCCKPSSPFWFFNLGNKIEVTELISPLENYFLCNRAVQYGLVQSHLTQHSPTD
ncbi:uncharacterized protein TNCV_4015851 [Trichonephila clavipes]|nr:uncharacterized protein TNCV_4015851 [Trichonephila clavipes]